MTVTLLFPPGVQKLTRLSQAAPAWGPTPAAVGQQLELELPQRRAHPLAGQLVLAVSWTVRTCPLLVAWTSPQHGGWLSEHECPERARGTVSPCRTSSSKSECLVH